MRSVFPGTLPLALAALLALACGCGPAYTTFDNAPLVGGPPGGFIRQEGFPINAIGVCGPLSAQVTELFVYGGYLARDLGPDAADCLDRAASFKLGYVAVVEPDPDAARAAATGADEIVLVMDVRTGLPLWRADGEDMARARRIRNGNPDMGLELALRDMVRSFSRTYPPARQGRSGG